jgi:hypothetical protein
MADTTPTAARLWKGMTLDQRQRAARAFWGQASSPAEQAQAVQAIAQHRKSRPKTIAGLDADARARHLSTVPTLPDAVATRVLVVYHLAEQRSMMGAFLDALGLTHDNGLIQDDHVVPDPARVGPAAAAIAAQYAAADVSLYLNTLLCQDPGTWGALEGLPQLQA